MTENKNWWEKVKEHPIYSKVIAGLILAALLTIFDKVFSWNIISSIFDFANQEYPIPVWGLMVIAITAMALLSVIIILISFFKGEPPRQVETEQLQTEIKPDWISYTEDIIFDMLWQWRYRWESIDSLRTDELIALCPKCKRELISVKVNTWDVNGYQMQCANCSFESKDYPSDEILKKEVIREIKGRIRNGEYKDKINKTK